MFGKKDSSADVTKAVPYVLSTELVPYRLYAKKSSNIMLRVKLKNVTKDVLLTSLVAVLPNRLGFDEMVLSREKESRVGEMQPGEEKEVKFSIYSSVGSDAGDYTINLTAIAHYRDYGHVLNAVKKRIQLSVV